MEVIPAIDLRGGRVVRLRQGDYAQETAYSADPVGVARGFQAEGAPRVHLVDLDGAATGAPAHLEVLRRIVEAVEIPVQTGGGLRSMEQIESAFATGVERIVLGSVALEEPSLVEQAVAIHGARRIVVGLDARDGLVAIRGWVEQSTVSAEELMGRMAALGVTRFVYTDIARDGTLAGPNSDAVAAMVRRGREHNATVIASGGVSTADHVRRLAELGAEGAILGSGLYTGTLTLADALKAADA
jgi:phosphoribosylformimino-5-aminoimidazole carboxamide ribotide isomerase